MAPKKDSSSVSVRPDALSGQKCIITGEIEGQSRKSAEQILVNAGATIEKSLNKKVTLVVLGADAGPKKLDKIEALGVETKDWEDLIEEIKGEGSAGPAEPMDEDNDEPEPEVEEKTKPKKAAAKSSTKANSKAKAAPAPAPKAAPKPSGSGADPDVVDGKKVIITGTIPGHDRKTAQSILENAGADFAKSLNKQVELVILGVNPGPDKLSKIEDLGIETIEWADLAGKLGLEVAPAKEVANVEAGDAPDSIDGMTLLITGEIDGHTRSSAQKILESAGATFAKSLNKSVELVVLGTNAGPDKLNKIAAQGIATCSWDSIIEKLGLQAEASEPPKKKAKKT